MSSPTIDKLEILSPDYSNYNIPIQLIESKADRQSKPIWQVRDLSVSFIQYTSGLRQQELQVMSSLNINIYPGEVLAVVGAMGREKPAGPCYPGDSAP